MKQTHNSPGFAMKFVFPHRHWPKLTASIAALVTTSLLFGCASPNDEVYIRQSYAQIIDPELTIADLEMLGDRLALPEGWRYRAVRLEEDFVLLSNGQTTVINDDLGNTYQRTDMDVDLVL